MAIRYDRLVFENVNLMFYKDFTTITGSLAKERFSLSYIALGLMILLCAIT